MLELLSISKSFANTLALDNLNLAVTPGSRTTIVGPSGSGKTTLLRILTGFETPDRGRIIMHGKSLFADGVSVPAHQRRIGYVPQEGALFPYLNVTDNIAWGLGASREEKRRRMGALVEMVALDTSPTSHWSHEISGGQQQHVALARALAQQPALILLDEPFSTLDTGLRASTRKAMMDLLAETGIALILVTRGQNEALLFATQVTVIRQGRLAQVGTPLTVYSQPADEKTALFLGDVLIFPARLSPGRANCALGDLATDTLHPAGKGRVMLYPGQLSVSVSESQKSTTIIHGVDFSGQLPTLMLSVTGHEWPIVLRTMNQSAWQPGAMVRLTVNGKARVFSG